MGGKERGDKALFDLAGQVVAVIGGTGVLGGALCVIDCSPWPIGVVEILSYGGMPALLPASTASTAPVIIAARSEQRKRTAAATSSGAISRPAAAASGAAAIIHASSAAGSGVLAIARSVMGPETGPGHTAFTRIRSAACASAMARVSMISPAFEAQ